MYSSFKYIQLYTLNTDALSSETTADISANSSVTLQQTPIMCT